MSKQLFKLGQIVATPGALDLEVDFQLYLFMHSLRPLGRFGSRGLARE